MKPTPNLSQSPAYQLWRAGNAWQRRARKALEPLGLTHAQFFLLGAVDILSRSHSCVTQAEIARFGDFDENTASQLIRILADRRLIHRERHPDDARARSITLTDEGLHVVEMGRAVVKPAMAEFFAPLREPGRFVDDLRTLVEVAEGTGGECPHLESSLPERDR